mgnify:CR=1 FL=1
MYHQTVEKLGQAATKKVNFLKDGLGRYFLLAMLAGMYVGIGIILVFSIGAPFMEAGSPAVRILLGISFGVALTLVIFAGAELFTGNNMIITIGWLEKRVSWKDGLVIWFWSYLGNLAGSILIAWLFYQTGHVSEAPLSDFVLRSTQGKMNAPFVHLFFRGVLCNILVCLAIWMTTRAREDAAKLILIWWALFAFVGSGFEHSIANMTLLSIGLMIPHNPQLISLNGFFANLIPVTLGNIVGGALIIGAGYWFISYRTVEGEDLEDKKIL